MKTQMNIGKVQLKSIESIVMFFSNPKLGRAYATHRLLEYGVTEVVRQGCLQIAVSSTSCIPDRVRFQYLFNSWSALYIYIYIYIMHAIPTHPIGPTKDIEVMDFLLKHRFYWFWICFHFIWTKLVLFYVVIGPESFSILLNRMFGSRCL